MAILDTGIHGLDELLGGGIPQSHIVCILGSPGTGKSTFSMQFIHSGLEKDENCIYLSLEESEEDIITTSRMFGWDFEPYIKKKKLTLIRLSPLNIKATIERVEDDLPKLLRKSQRLVLDPITLYEMIHDSERERREHLFNFAQNVKKSGITTLMTSETSSTDPYNSKYGLIEYIADGVIILRRMRQTDMRQVSTIIEISKMRRVDHSKEIKPYNIGQNGVEVHSDSEVFSDFKF